VYYPIHHYVGQTNPLPSSSSGDDGSSGRSAFLILGGAIFGLAAGVYFFPSHRLLLGALGFLAGGTITAGFVLKQSQTLPPVAVAPSLSSEMSSSMPSQVDV
jgi:hypothetical protein